MWSRVIPPEEQMMAYLVFLGKAKGAVREVLTAVTRESRYRDRGKNTGEERGGIKVYIPRRLRPQGGPLWPSLQKPGKSLLHEPVLL